MEANNYNLNFNPELFKTFSTRAWENIHVNTVRHAIVCNVHFYISKIL